MDELRTMMYISRVHGTDKLFYLTPPPGLRPVGARCVTVGRSVTEPGERYPPKLLEHPHRYRSVSSAGRRLTEWQCVYIAEGAGHFTAEQGVVRDVSAGELMIIRPDEWHQYAPDERSGWAECWVGFTGVTLDQAVAALQLHQGPSVISCRDSGAVEAIYRRLLALAEQHEVASHLSMVATVLELLSLIARWAGRGENVDCSEPVSRAVILMSNSVERGISVKSVAAEVGLSPSSLRRRFVAEMGMSPYHYFNTLRINQIKMDLAHTAQPLKKIAERLGFTDQYHLSRLFKHYVGVSPSAWRATGG